MAEKGMTRTKRIIIRLPQNTWAITSIVAIFVAFMFGMIAGYKIAEGIYKKEIARISLQLESIKEDSNTEIRFWQDTLRGLADGDQLDGVELK